MVGFLRSLVSRIVPIVLMLVAAPAVGVWLLGSRNPYTPAGYVGYLTKGAVFQHEAIEAQKLMVNSPNHTTVYIPVGPMGVPLTGAFAAPPQTSPRGGSLPR